MVCKGQMGDLKKIYEADGPGDAHVLRGLLEVEGIDAVVRGDDMVPLQGGSLSFVEMRTSVWVLDDDGGQYARAVEIAGDYAARRQEPAEMAGGAGAVWRCRSCGETVEEQFTACWSCGADRGRRP